MRLFSKPRFLTRLVLAWFAAAVLAAGAAPLVKPGSFELVCGAHGAVKLVALGSGDNSELRGTLDCPLCGSLLAGPVGGQSVVPVLARAVLAGVPTEFARLGATPLSLPPARGPPSTSLLPIS